MRNLWLQQKEASKTHVVHTIVNGRDWYGNGELSYQQVVSMAGYDANRILSVTYRSDTARGILSPSESVQTTDGMAFSVYDTSQA